MIRVTTLIAVATARVLAATGCGGSKKSSAGASSGSTSTVASGRHMCIMRRSYYRPSSFATYAR